MTSTEVQRTLVKSPPELWAELSDPDSLARLLGELGEVRITSVEPESAVRWEAAKATGSVQIRPSAWGTKVTLSVTRRGSEAQAASAPQALSAAPPASAPEPSSSSRPAGTQQPEPAPTEILRPAVEPGPAPRDHAPDESAPMPDAGPRTKPATAYARKEPSRQEPQLSDTDEGVPEPTGIAAPSPKPTRRGLFARLFGWRSHEPAEPEQAADGDELARSSHLDEREGDERERSAAEDGAPSALEALQARYEHHPIEGPPVATGGAEAHAELPPQPATPQPAGLSAELRAAEEHGAGGPREENAAAECADAPLTTGQCDEHAEAAAHDESLSAGPSDEQMQAILAGVLDRLGAAHHRPFSRA